MIYTFARLSIFVIQSRQINPIEDGKQCYELAYIKDIFNNIKVWDGQTVFENFEKFVKCREYSVTALLEQSKENFSVFFNLYNKSIDCSKNKITSRNLIRKLKRNKHFKLTFQHYKIVFNTIYNKNKNKFIKALKNADSNDIRNKSFLKIYCAFRKIFYAICEKIQQKNERKLKTKAKMKNLPRLTENAKLLNQIEKSFLFFPAVNYHKGIQTLDLYKFLYYLETNLTKVEDSNVANDFKKHWTKIHETKGYDNLQALDLYHVYDSYFYLFDSRLSYLCSIFQQIVKMQIRDLEKKLDIDLNLKKKLYLFFKTIF